MIKQKWGICIKDDSSLNQRKEYFYSKWIGMLTRCYSDTELLKYPTYVGCCVCEEWLTFSNFKSWMEKQDWEGKHLDKDLLVYGNKIYSPQTCVFITPKLNTFLTKCDARRGKYPIGVSYRGAEKDMVNEYKHPYRARIRSGGKSKSLGDYSTPEAAHRAWQKEKIKLAKIFLKVEDNTPAICGLCRMINKLSYDYSNSIETKYF